MKPGDPVRIKPNASFYIGDTIVGRTVGLDRLQFVRYTTLGALWLRDKRSGVQIMVEPWAIDKGED